MRLAILNGMEATEQFTSAQHKLSGLTSEIIRCALKVHTVLGPGLMESAYEACLKYELQKAGLGVESQVVLPIKYEEIVIEAGYRIDLLVERQVIVELKSVESIHNLHKAQLLSYLKLRDLRVGLLINFNVAHLRDGITRMVNSV